MSKAAVVAYVNSGKTLPAQQFCKSLDDLIKTRGVDFTFSYLDASLQPIIQSACFYQPWDVATAIKYNFGAPAPMSFLMGKWTFWVIGGTVDRAHSDGYVYRKEESGAIAGTLQVNGDNTYVWNVANRGTINGKWRLPTDAERGLHGGAAIVLLGGENGADWIVYRYHGDQQMIEALYVTGGGGMRRLGRR